MLSNYKDIVLVTFILFQRKKKERKTKATSTRAGLAHGYRRSESVMREEAGSCDG